MIARLRAWLRRPPRCPGCRTRLNGPRQVTCPPCWNRLDRAVRNALTTHLLDTGTSRAGVAHARRGARAELRQHGRTLR